MGECDLDNSHKTIWSLGELDLINIASMLKHGGNWIQDETSILLKVVHLSNLGHDKIYYQKWLLDNFRYEQFMNNLWKWHFCKVAFLIYQTSKEIFHHIVLPVLSELAMILPTVTWHWS